MIYFPKNDSNLYTDLVEEFKNKGHDVYVAAILEKKYGESTYIKEEKNGLKVLRIKSGNLFKVNYIIKGITSLSLPYLFKKAIKKYFNSIRFDLIIYPTPPITLAPIVSFLKKRDKCKTYLILRDIFPQNAKDLGMINNNLIFEYFRKKEKILYDISDHIGCMSRGNIDYVVKHNNIDPNKLELLYNWKREIILKNEVIDYRKKYGLENKFVAIFGGNIGYAQELTFLLKLAKIYKNREDIIFLIVGDGIERERIENIVKKENLKNVLIKDPLPREEYDQLIKVCDVGLVNLSHNFTIPNFPSKSTGYFESGIPILAATDKNTDFGKLLEETKTGLWSETGDLKSYQENFEKLLNDKSLREKLGKKGKDFFEENMKVQSAYSIISKHM
jgi:glycosyltransferase involved in cell wall biosynthesis